MSDDDDLDRLREETETGDRLAQATHDVDQDELVESIVEEMDSMEADNRQPTISVWDRQFAALFGALDNEDLESIGEALREDLDVDPQGEPDRSEVLRNLLRVALLESAPEYMEALVQAVVERSTRDL